MTDGSTFERRIAVLLGALADQMPTDVNPVAMTRMAATARPASIVSLRVGALELSVRLGVVGLVLALLGAIAGSALVAGRLLERPPLGLSSAPVAPFIGLPPVGADPSEPASGELVIRFSARMSALGMEAQQSYLYADGRLIWQRNLEGSEAAQRIFGSLEPTRAVIEQRLTSLGVALVEADVLAAKSTVAGEDGKPGTLWGDVEVRIDGSLRKVLWTDSGLPARLADPGSWLPDSAWADRDLRGYVPSRYGICLGSDVVLSEMPQMAADLLRGRDGFIGPGSPSSIGTCRVVTTEVAREVAAALDAAGVKRRDSEWQLGYELGRCCLETGVSFQEVLPDGELLLRGG